VQITHMEAGLNISVDAACIQEAPRRQVSPDISYASDFCIKCDPKPLLQPLNYGEFTVIEFTVYGKHFLEVPFRRTHIIRTHGHRIFDVPSNINGDAEIFTFIEGLLSHVIWEHKTCHKDCENNPTNIKRRRVDRRRPENLSPIK
jgi:hypothetical protein